MKPIHALGIIQALQNVALQKGLFSDVKAVNQVSLAIATLQAALLETSTNENS